MLKLFELGRGVDLRAGRALRHLDGRVRDHASSLGAEDRVGLVIMVKVVEVVMVLMLVEDRHLVEDLVGPLHLQIPLHPLATLMLRGEHRRQQFAVHHHVLATVGRGFPGAGETFRPETPLYSFLQPLQPQLLAVLGEGGGGGGEGVLCHRPAVRGRLGRGGEGNSRQLVVGPRRLQRKDLDPFYQLFYARAQVDVARRGQGVEIRVLSIRARSKVERVWNVVLRFAPTLGHDALPCLISVSFCFLAMEIRNTNAWI